MSYPVGKRCIDDSFTNYLTEPNKKRNFNGREVNRSYFLDLPTEIFIKIFSLVSLKEAYFFSLSCTTNRNLISSNIKIINENIFSNYFKKFQSQIDSKEIVSDFEKIKKEIVNSEFSKLQIELFDIRFKIIDFLSSKIGLSELKILADSSHFTDPFRLSELAWLIRGLKICFGFTKENSRNIGLNSVKNWLFEAVKRCQVEEMKIVVMYCINIYSERSQSKTKRNDNQGLQSINKILFSSDVADENLRLLFSEILVNGSVSFLADLFKIVGEVLLTHPLLNGNDNTCLPSCITHLAQFGGQEKLKHYLEKNKQLPPHVQDIFTIAILFDEFSQCFKKEKNPTSLHFLLTQFFKNAGNLKLNCYVLRNKTISYLVHILLENHLPKEIQQSILFAARDLVNTVTEVKLNKKLITNLAHYLALNP